MATQSLIEQRLSAVEVAVAQLKRQLPPPAVDWIEQITGTFKNEPAFDEVIAHGPGVPGRRPPAGGRCIVK